MDQRIVIGAALAGAILAGTMGSYLLLKQRRPAPPAVVQPVVENVAAISAAVESPQVEKWVYKQVVRSKPEGKSGVPVSHLLMESELNDAGNDGWELVAVTHVLAPAQAGDREHAMVATFKRPKK